MADTYTPSLRLQLQQTGGNLATWGIIADTQYTLLESSITGDNGYLGGAGGINVAGLTVYSMTVALGAADQSRQALYPFVGALTAPCTVTIPGVVKIGWVLNATTGGQSIVMKVGSGGTATVVPGGWTMFYCDGTNVTLPTTAFSSLQTGITIITDNTSQAALTINSAANPTGANIRLLGNGATAPAKTMRVVNGLLQVVNNAYTTVIASLDDVGNFTIPGSFNSGAGTFAGALTVAGLSALNGGINTTSISAGPINATNGSFVGTLYVAGVSTLSGTVNTNTLNATVINASGASSINSSLFVTGALTVGGAVNLGNTLNVGGGTTLSSTGFYMTAAGITSVATSWSAGISVTAANAMSSLGFFTVSDRRTKDDIAAITPDEGAEWVRKGQPRTYTVDGRPSAGFIAQDELKNGRHASVTMTPDNDDRFSVADGLVPAGQRLSIDYTHHIAYLTAALQHALARLDAAGL